MKKYRGFTIIELLVAIAIMTVGATAATLYLAGYQGKHNLTLALGEIVAATRDAQNRSVTQQDGKQWGIRFNNGSADKYEIFSGSSYASGTVDHSYNFRQGIVFSEPTTNSVFDAIFESLTGHLNQHKIISLITGKSDGLVGDILINSSGLITTRIEKNLVSYWHIDEGTSTIAYDASGRNNNGTLLPALPNGPTWQTESNCRAGKCLSFDGTNDYVQTPTGVSNITSDFTYSIFIFPTQNNDGIWRGIVGNLDYTPTMYGANLMQLSQALQVFWGSSPNYYTWSSKITSANTWYHLVLKYDSGTFYLYINGILQTGTKTQAINQNNTKVTIGRWDQDYNNYYFKGTIDEVRIYNRVLSAAEILQLYNDLK